jgi:UDP-glucose 4-epimerase
MSAPFAGRHVLVTGGAGFIGSHLVEALVAGGADVAVIDSLSTGRLSNLRGVEGRVTLHALDLATDDLRPVLRARPVDALFHLAGNANVTRSVAEPRDDFRRNVVATVNVLDALRNTSPRTSLVFTSSATVYGEGASVPIREDDPLVPISPYGASKLACEHYVRLYAHLYGLRTGTARLFSVYGPRLRKQVIYDLMCKLASDPEELPMHGDGSQVRDMNHVASMVSGLLVIAGRAPLSGECYNVAAGRQYTIRELAERLCAAMGVAPRFAWSGEVRSGETQAWYPDISRARALGYEPTMDLEEGLADTVRWFREEEAGREEP